MTTPLEMIVRILSQGGTIQHSGNKYVMDEEGQLCIIMQSDFDGEVPLPIDCYLPELKKIADEIGEDQLWLQCCELQHCFKH